MDVHRGPQSTPEGNFKAAQAWYDRLVAARFLPVLTDSNGTGGYHLWVVFDQPLPSMRVAEFGRSLAADFNHFDLPVAPRTFPSVAAVRSGGQGNWVRLPGHHPLSDHWTRVWNGRHWLEGADAVEALLHAHGDSQRVLRDFEANLANTNVANTNVVNTDGVRRGAIGSSRVLVVPASQATTPSLSPAASQSAVSSQAFPPPSAPVPPLASASSASVLPNGTSPVPAVVDPRSEADRLQALRYLNAIQSGRARAYHEWLRVGMALHDVDPGEAMLLAWDDWSRSLPHYAPGLCARRWRTFNGPGDRAAALGHLREWAEEDAAHSTPGNGPPPRGPRGFRRRTPRGDRRVACPVGPPPGRRGGHDPRVVAERRGGPGRECRVAWSGGGAVRMSVAFS